MPREYGAYAELAFPLATALVAGGASIASTMFALAAGAGFLLHEPVAIVRGGRGARLREALARRAHARIRWLVALGAAAGAAALFAAPKSARVGAAFPAVCALLLVAPVARGREKTLGAELLMAAALAGMLAPVGLSAGLHPRFVAVATFVWFASFGLATLLVHAIKALGTGATRPWTRTATPILAVGVVGAAAVAATLGSVPRAAGLAVLPTAVVATAAVAARVGPRRLRQVGWTLVAADGMTLVLLLHAARIP